MSSLSEVSVTLTCYDSILPPTFSLFIAKMAFPWFFSVPGVAGTVAGRRRSSGAEVTALPAHLLIFHSCPSVDRE